MQDQLPTLKPCSLAWLASWPMGEETQGCFSTLGHSDRPAPQPLEGLHSGCQRLAQMLLSGLCAPVEQ